MKTSGAVIFGNQLNNSNRASSGIFVSKVIKRINQIINFRLRKLRLAGVDVGRLKNGGVGKVSLQFQSVEAGIGKVAGDPDEIAAHAHLVHRVSAIHDVLNAELRGRDGRVPLAPGQLGEHQRVAEQQRLPLVHRRDRVAAPAQPLVDWLLQKPRFPQVRLIRQPRPGPDQLLVHFRRILQLIEAVLVFQGRALCRGFSRIICAVITFQLLVSETRKRVRIHFIIVFIRLYPCGSITRLNSARALQQIDITEYTGIV